ncbi:MAG: Gfo/Idh/MocA family oxidoreductase [Bacteroides sp.]|nr:Gfo/Idh/MocA family oxidoreductase [Bacteroides sp.]
MSSRREFLRKAFASAATLAAAGMLPGGFMASAKSQRRVIGANDRIRVAVIGVNSRGRALAQGFARMPLCDVTYLCDVDSKALERSQADIKNITGTTPRGERDMRRVFESPDVDAVVIALPDHWHAPAAIMAMQAGKHVYLEKPTSHNPAENELLMRAAAKYGTVVQVGNQRRSWPNVQAAIREIHDGNIGDVHYAKSWYVNNRPSIGIGKVVPVPDHIDWDLWQGPAPRVADFKDNFLHYNWHWFWHWGTGEALNNGTHFVDILRWGLGVEYPTLVSSVGGRYNHTHDDWETPDTQMMTFQFGDKATCSWEGRSCNSTPVDGSGVGTAFYGDKGTVFITGGNEYRVTDPSGKLIKDVKSEMAFEEGNLLNPSENLDTIHFVNWFDAIRNGSRLNSGIVDACISTQLVQLGNIAQRVGRSLNIDPSNGHIIGDPEAMKLYSRDYEPGWEPKV